MGVVTLVCPVCPHCGVEKVAYELEAQVSQLHERSAVGVGYHQLWKCCNCGQPACSSSWQEIMGGHNTLERLQQFFPIPKDISAPYGVPGPIGNTFRSAMRYLQSGRDADYDASCVMARKGIELAVAEFGGTGRNLFQKIDDLEHRRLIPPAIRDWSQHIRDIGNDGAHEPLVTREEAQQAVLFAEMLFTYLYSLPQKMEEYQNRH